MPQKKISTTTLNESLIDKLIDVVSQYYVSLPMTLDDCRSQFRQILREEGTKRSAKP